FSSRMNPPAMVSSTCFKSSLLRLSNSRVSRACVVGRIQLLLPQKIGGCWIVMSPHGISFQASSTLTRLLCRVLTPIPRAAVLESHAHSRACFLHFSHGEHEHLLIGALH